MAVTKACAEAIRRGLRKGMDVTEIADRVGVQPQTVRDFKAGKDTARTSIRKGSGGPAKKI